MPFSPRALKVGGYITWLSGLSVAIALIAVQGVHEVLAATSVAGWALLWVPAIQLLPMCADTLAWQRLIAPSARVPFRVLFWARWIGESVNHLLPVAAIGGEVLRAWLAHRAAKLSGALAGGTVVVDLTLGVLTLIVFTLMGLGVLLTHGIDGYLVETTAILVGLLTSASLAFIFVQKAGMFDFSSRLIKLVAGRVGWTSIVDDARKLDDAIRTLYTRPGPLIECIVWRLLGWLTGTLEVWAALWVLGHPVSLAEALMLESLVQAVRSAGFMVPGALGIQEGGIILIGSVIGLGPEVALALSLVKRIRELILGLPGLVVWQLSALHELWVAASERDMRG